jgi:hypothetical protein
VVQPLLEAVGSVAVPVHRLLLLLHWLLLELVMMMVMMVVAALQSHGHLVKQLEVVLELRTSGVWRSAGSAVRLVQESLGERVVLDLECGDVFVLEIEDNLDQTVI